MKPTLRNKVSSNADFSSRKRGSVLVLVVAVLGILFVMGVTFLATMNYASEEVLKERKNIIALSQDGAIADEILANIVTPLVTERGIPFGAERFSDEVRTAYAEIPGIHNTFSPVEPVLIDPGTPNARFVFPTHTDIIANSFYAFENDLENGARQRVMAAGTAQSVGVLAPGQNNPILYKGVDCSWAPGVPVSLIDAQGAPLGANNTIFFASFANYDGLGGLDFLPVDADGDGISDAEGVNARILDFPDRTVRDLSNQVNPENNPSGNVYIGTRIVDHGAKVNLNEAHPTLLDVLFDHTEEDYLTTHGPSRPDDNQRKFYSPVLNEYSLTRRNGLLSRYPAPSSLLGNPLLPDDQGAAGDLSAQLFPSNAAGPGIQSVRESNHQFEPYDWNQGWQIGAETYPLWAVRNMADIALADRNNPDAVQAYDRLHLSTTVSYDDNLARGTMVIAPPANGLPGKRRDVVDVMREANRIQYAFGGPEVGCDNPAFEMPLYPHDISNNGQGCDCGVEAQCENIDIRKGRLKLSIPWLDAAAENQVINEQRRIDLIYDYFFTMLLNSRSFLSGFGSFVDYNPDPNLVNTQWVHAYNNVSLTAAMLTANFLDYADSDNIPTAVQVRNMNFGNLDNTDSLLGNQNNTPPAAGTNSGRFVFGLERQPYITEVAVVIQGLADVQGIQPDFPKAWAVELFNPNAEDILDDDRDLALISYVNGATQGQTGYIGDYFNQNGGVASRQPVRLNGDIPGRVDEGAFTVFIYGDSEQLENIPNSRNINDRRGVQAGLDLIPTDVPQGEGEWVIALVDIRSQFSNNLNQPLNEQWVILDTFELRADEEADELSDEGETVYRTVPGQVMYAADHLRSLGRFDTSVNPWTAPVPTEFNGKLNIDSDLVLEDTDVHSLGGQNFGLYSSAQTGTPRPLPVELLLANVPSNKLADAYPTTGSMLLTNRYANQSIQSTVDNIANGETDLLAYTSYLHGFIGSLETRFSYVPANDPPAQEGFRNPLEMTEQTISNYLGKSNSYQFVDNGRMPVFDEVRFEHRDPGRFNLVYPDENVRSAPGEIDQLPWGQLIFDYFTALPLENGGPYRPNDPDDPEFQVASESAQPRVDMNGLRVHGRINLNSANWKVISGLPLMPMESMPAAIRNRLSRSLGNVDLTNNVLDNDVYSRLEDEDRAGIIGEDLAKAIVAYRDNRELFGSADNNGNASTGDYSLMRGWTEPELPNMNTGKAAQWPAQFRRGTGFLSVGELANIRYSPFDLNSGAKLITSDTFNPNMRIDRGFADNSVNGYEDYIDAIAILVALGDWATVRSHVSTVYGHIRGDFDPEQFDDLLGGAGTVTVEDLVADVDSRAIRFQETVDRIPALLGDRLPARIGERVIAGYTDFNND